MVSELGKATQKRRQASEFPRTLHQDVHQDVQSKLKKGRKKVVWEYDWKPQGCSLWNLNMECRMY